MNSIHTYSLIAHAMYKYRVITKQSRPLYTELLARATGTRAEFQAPARKFKRDAVTSAIREWNNNSNEGFATTGDDEVRRLVYLTAEKNSERAGYASFADHCDALDENGSPFAVNLCDFQFDPESSDYEYSVMVRPIEVIRAEQAERAEVIRLERMVAIQREEDDDFDDSDDDWDLDDEQADSM